MYLKSLEINGFKTFADRTDIEFIPGFMAIVGPNGSGKSNLTDALRYCLGEQSCKALRAARQEELIFAGTVDRRPCPFCEVTAVFDNSDGHLPVEFTEVAITRRSSREGDSQYLINRTPCRLRDIHELLMDTGIGPGSFSILGGKEVDMVLSSDPGDRRSMIEETAGTNRYRFRKREAARKLDQTADNIQRLHDILTEVNTNFEDSKKALARYERYKKAQDELRGLSGAIAHAEAQKLKAEEETGRKLLEKAEQDSHNADVLEEQLKNELIRKENENADKLNLQNKAREALGEARVKLSAAKAASAASQQAALQFAQTRDEAQKRLENYASRQKSRSEEIETLSDEIAEIEQAMRQEGQDLAKLIDAFSNFTNPEEELSAELRHKLDQNLDEIKKLEHSIETAKLEAEHCRKKSAEAAESAEKLRKEAESIAMPEADFEKARLMAEKASKAEKDAKEKQKECASAIAALRQERTSTERRFQNAKIKVMELEGSLDERAGLPMSVRTVLRWNVPGTLGALGNLITVKEGLELAIEAALGGKLFDIVTEDRHTAQKLIERLKAEKAGRVTFWPLDLERREPPELTLPATPGFIGRAPSLISFPSKIQPLIDQMLGQTVVVRDYSAAMNLYDKCRGRRPHIVTLQGEYLSPAGAVTGGAQKTDRSGMFAKKRMLAEAIKQKDSIREEIDNLSRKEEKLALTLRSIAEDLNKAQEEIRLARQLSADEEAEAQRCQKETARIMTACAKSSQEACDMQAKAEQADKLIAEETELLEKLLIENNQLKSDLAIYQEKEAEINAKRETLRLEISSKRNKKSESEQNCQEKKRSLSQLQSRFKELEEDSLLAKDEIERANSGIEAADKETARQNECINECMTQASKANSDLKAIGEALGSIGTEIENLKTSSEEAGKLAREKGENLARCRADHAILLEKLQKALEILAETGDVSQIDPDFDIDKARAKAARLQNTLENFGSVNLGAREDYDRLNTRRNELNTQICDLEEAAAQFREIMAEMDKASIERFQYMFSRINRTFGAIFSDIFGGGQARLELCEPDDLLSSGIDIIACPPGKKLQNLTAFSSGERALSAIAFLLALLTHKPSPIVILDELDAPLDDSNVEKIASRLRTFSASSQFLVITHNRKTMEFAERLYGVTMEQKGVSRMLSVTLEPAKE
ncbi:MAG: chromosome segregation protein SMC [bacterium]|nr:chromosome segregation protein SMC [bacterium]